MINITTTTASTGIRFDLSKDNSIKDTKRFANSHAVPFNMLRISWVVPVPPDCQSVESLRVRIESALPVSGARTLPGIGFLLSRLSLDQRARRTRLDHFGARNLYGVA